LDPIQPKLETLTTQPEVSGFLSGLLAGAHVSSLLFSGPEGSGKKTHALAFVKSLFCRNGASCPGCSDCRQVDSKAHPDLLWVQKGFFWPEEEEDRKSNDITGGVISAVTEKLSLAPLNAPWKVVVVPDAHRMNVNAQDKFLKTLEEPPRRGIILLVTDQPAALLPTIQSRCRMVRFHPLSVEVTEKILRSRAVDAPTAKLASAVSGGNLKRAFAYTDPAWRAFLDKAPKDFDQALQGGDVSWLKVVDEYDQLDPGFWEDEDLSAAQRKSRVAEEFLRASLAAWGGTTRDSLPSLDAVLIRSSIRRHLDWLSGNLSARMVLDHLFLETREIAKTGRYEPATWMDTTLRA
jgi:DNA polymerase III delta' subunit